MNLVSAAIVVRATTYLERDARTLVTSATPTDENLLQYPSPLGWDHINLTGDYVWRSSARLEPGKFRPLRPSPIV